MKKNYTEIIPNLQEFNNNSQLTVYNKKIDYQKFIFMDFDIFKYMKDNLIESFFNTGRYRKKILKLTVPYENRLMFETYKKINKAEEIHEINLKMGKKPYLLTFMDITVEHRKKINSFLSRNGIKYFQNVEFTKTGKPHLHVIAYIKDEREAFKIKKKFAFANSLFDETPSFHIQEQKELELENGYIYKEGWKYPFKDLYKDELHELSQIRKFGNQVPEFQSYFDRKAMLRYHGFSRAFLSSRVPKRDIEPKIEAKKFEEWLEKFANFEEQNMDFAKTSIIFPNIRKEELSKVKKILSYYDLPFFGILNIVKGKIVANIDIFEISEKSFLKALKKIENIFGKKVEVSNNFVSKIKNSLFGKLSNLATKKLSQIVDEKSRLFNLGLSREVFSS
jgi:hypothetical protein